MKKGDNIVVVKGPQRGRVGVLLEISGRCGGEDAVQVMLKGKRVNTITFYPMSYVVATK